MESHFSVWVWILYAVFLIITLGAALLLIIYKDYIIISAAVIIFILLIPFLIVLLIIEAPYNINEAVFIYQEVLNLNWQALLAAFMHLFIIAWWGLLVMRFLKYN